jgi:hypothetical protein
MRNYSLLAVRNGFRGEVRCLSTLSTLSTRSSRLRARDWSYPSLATGVFVAAPS